ncbi:Transcription repressor like [Quillaja saponaria]|uniref:Transcription repressor n=1 Tax=Quillaja saponaria TaxID=32244 RepID=A0AAD7PAF0_QUISA|nr:Transcription repressor like [Quillaja saponaria]
MSSHKKCRLWTLFTAKNGGCGCGRPKLSAVYEPTPKPKISCSQISSSERNCSLSSNDDKEDLTSMTISKAAETDQKSSIKTSTINNKNKIPDRHCYQYCADQVTDSIAVEKESEDPYKDFRHSMLQMIFEKEIYLENDLQELLSCFLKLNSPSHHHVIVKAFKEICDEVFSRPPKHM